MNAAQHLIGGVLLSMALGTAMAETATAPQIVATSWTPAQSAAPAMSQAGALPTTPSPLRHATTQTADEGHSNGRLMLIGGLLIGVIALRSRKNFG